MNNQTHIKQLSKGQAIIYHLYPGIIILLSFVVFAPLLATSHYPPQLAILASIVVVAIPLFISHLNWAKKKESRNRFWQLNAYRNKLSNLKLVLYSLGLVVFMFLVWGVTQPLDKVISQKLLAWLPSWFAVQDFQDTSKEVIVLTLVVNLIVNGFLAPFFEEFYFRAYLLPRMAAWGKWAFVCNAVLFSLYHFWQPNVYLTLIVSLLPMTWLVWKTKDLRLAILTHSLLNIVGALLSFGLIVK